MSRTYIDEDHERYDKEELNIWDIELDEFGIPKNKRKKKPIQGGSFW